MNNGEACLWSRRCSIITTDAETSPPQNLVSIILSILGEILKESEI